MTVDPARPLLYLADYSANSVVVINTTSNTEVKSIPVGSGPEGLDISADGSELYVALSLADGLAVVNLNTLALSRTIPLNAPPFDVVAGRLGRAYVTRSGDGYPGIIDTVKNKEIGNITSAGTITFRALVRVTPNRQFLFIAETGGQNERVFKFSITSDKVSLISTANSDLGSSHLDFTLSPDGLWLYMASGSPYNVVIANDTDWSLHGGLYTGPYPNSVSIPRVGGVVFATHSTNEVIAFNASTSQSIKHFLTTNEAVMVRAENPFTAYVITLDINGGRHLESIETVPPHWAAGSYLHVYWVSQTNVAMNWTGAVDDVGVVGYRLHVNGSLYVSLGSVIQAYNVTGLFQNTHYTFKVEAGDASDNWSNDGPSASATTLLDTTPPDTPTLLQPADASVTSNPYPFFTWSSVSDPSGVTYILQVSSNPNFSSPQINVTGLSNPRFQGTIRLADGDYSWHVRAIDGAGNLGSYSNTFTFRVDTSIPNPGGYRYALLYNLEYTRPSPGSTVKMMSIFNNTGNVLERITGITLTFDFGTYTATSGLPLIIPIGRSSELNMSITIPASVSPGSHTITASISFQYLAPNSTGWVTPNLSPLVASGTVTVASNPAENPSIVSGIIDLIIVLAAALAVMLVVIFRVTRRKAPTVKAIPSPPPTPPTPAQPPVNPGPGEAKIDLIPRILIQGSTGPKQFGLLLTDRRSILVLEKKPSGAGVVGGALGGALGALAGTALEKVLTSKEMIDYQNTTPEALAADENNITIPHSSIQSFELKKGVWKAPSRLIIAYERPEGGLKKLKATLVPPRDLIKQRKSQGSGLHQTRLEYARSVQEAYRRTLPPEVVAKARWQF